MKLIFATNNQNKVAEIKSALTNGLEIITLKEAGIDIDIPEPHNTLEENATEKSKTIHNFTKLNCFSEDTGLEVASLNGEPGVFSARYAGEPSDNKKNIALILKNLQNIHERTAQFKTVISLILDNVEHQFTGICRGKIIHEEVGEMGFGYDAIFVPFGANKTFAQMMMEEKNKYSHRKKALAKLIEFLNNYNGKN
jgi:XTP/dITP diphosphohydrolase